MHNSSFVCGGPVPFDSEVYIIRQEQELAAFNAINNKNYISIVGPRQVGKTSFLQKIQTTVEIEKNYATAYLDLSAINDSTINFKKWILQFDKLLQTQISRWYLKDKEVSCPKDFADLIVYWGELADAVNRPALLILLDEANSVPSHIRDPFYSTLRTIYIEKTSRSARPAIKKINFAFAGVFYPDELVANRQNSPFNVSKKIWLRDFSSTELQALSSVFFRVSQTLMSEDLIFDLTNGHPYISQSLFDIILGKVLQGEYDGNEIVSVRDVLPHLLDSISDNVDHTIKMVLRDDEKRNKIIEILQKKVPFTQANETISQLVLDGIVKKDAEYFVSIRNKIYKDSISKALQVSLGVESGSPAQKTKIFVSYSHKDDSRYIEKLRTHLQLLSQKNKIDLWDDSNIEPGSRWMDEIDRALDDAQIVILMVSPDFIASSFINEHELPRILAAAAQKGVKILWVPVSASSYRDTEINDYQAVIDPSRPLDKMTDGELSEALVKVYDAVRDKLS